MLGIVPALRSEMRRAVPFTISALRLARGLWVLCSPLPQFFPAAVAAVITQAVRPTAVATERCEGTLAFAGWAALTERAHGGPSRTNGAKRR